MAEKNSGGLTPWVDGHYICKGMATMTLLVEGETITLEGGVIQEGDPLAKGTWKFGEFGEADPAIVEATGNKFYNWSMEAYGGRLKKKGVISKDGKKAIFVNRLKEVEAYEWVSEEELAAFKDSGDPADAPSSHYKLQPDNQGKFLFLSGPPGLGKSTTGLLLSKMAGYVYYEADCFMQGTNPYIPPHVKEPTLQSARQKPLTGISQERKDAVAGGMKDFMALIEGKEYSQEPLEKFFGALCEDLSKERKRMGGDWAVAHAVPLRSLRDFIRAQLGPDLIFVVLTMGKEEQRKRIIARHGESVELLEKAFDIFEPAADDEPSTLHVNVTADMTPEEVVEKILKMVQE